MIVGIYFIFASIAMAVCELVLFRSISNQGSAVSIIACIIIMVFDAVFSAWLFAGGIAMIYHDVKNSRNENHRIKNHRNGKR